MALDTHARGRARPDQRRQIDVARVSAEGEAFSCVTCRHGSTTIIDLLCVGTQKNATDKVCLSVTHGLALGPLGLPLETRGPKPTTTLRFKLTTTTDRDIPPSCSPSSARFRPLRAACEPGTVVLRGTRKVHDSRPREF